MGRTNEFTLVAVENFAGQVGCAVAVGATMVHKTPVGDIAGATEAIDGIVTDITAGTPNKLLAVARLGDIAFALVGAGGVTVGAELEVGANGTFVEHESGMVVAKALATGVEGELVPVIIK